jgi:hypothetical protein
MGKTPDEIGAEYNLALAEIYAALAYYFDYREAIDQSIMDDEAFVEALRTQTPSVLQERLRALAK